MICQQAPEKRRSGGCLDSQFGSSAHQGPTCARMIASCSQVRGHLQVFCPGPEIVPYIDMYATLPKLADSMVHLGLWSVREWKHAPPARKLEAPYIPLT